MVSAEVKALLGAINMRVQVQAPDERLGAAPRDAENDEIKRSSHRLKEQTHTCEDRIIGAFVRCGKRLGK
jgi:hypothetical protein